MPYKVEGEIIEQAEGRNSPAAVPSEFSGEMFFKDGVSSSFYCSFVTHTEEWAMISGEQGSIHIPDFVLPHYGSEITIELDRSDLNIEGCDFNMERRVERIRIPEYSNSHGSAQDTNLFRNFAEQVRAGRLNEDWPEIALRTQEVMEECYRCARKSAQV